MLSTPLQSSYKFGINIRPNKLSFFVPEDNMAAVARAMRFAGSKWGGIHSVIVPMNPSFKVDTYYETLLRLHEPDQFISYLQVDEDIETRDLQSLQSYLRELVPHRNPIPQPGKYFEESLPTAHALWMIPEDLRENNVLTIHEINSHTIEHLAIYGQVFSGEERYFTEMIGTKSVPNPMRIVGDFMPFWNSQSSRGTFRSVLNLTSYGIVPYETSPTQASNHFDVVVGSSIQAVCLFWNLRATREATHSVQDHGRRTLLMPESLLSDGLAWTHFIEFVRSNLVHPYYSANLHIHFFVPDETLREQLIERLQDTEGVEPFTAQSRIVNLGIPATQEDLAEGPITFLILQPTFPSSYSEGIDIPVQVSTELRFGDNEILYSPPASYFSIGGYVAVDYISEAWKRFPAEHRIASVIKNGGWFSRYGISFTGNIPQRPHSHHFNIPSEWETLELFFGSRGYGIQMSPIAKYTTAFVELLGGIDQASILASKAAYLILDTLAPKSSEKLARRIVGQLDASDEDIPTIRDLLNQGDSVPDFRQLHRTYEEFRHDERFKPFRKQLLELLSNLSKAQIVKRGVQLRCTNCATPSWYSMRIVDETVICPGCSSEFFVPVEHPRGSDLRWKYTLNTLASRLMDQDGLPTVLTLRFLTQDLSSNCIVPGLELTRDSVAEVEYDWIFVSDQKVFAGECKAGTEIGDKDVRNTRLAAELGFHHFYFSTIKQFSDQTLEVISELSREFEQAGSAMTIDTLSGVDLLGEAIE